MGKWELNSFVGGQNILVKRGVRIHEIHAKHEDYLRAKMFLMAINFNIYENIVSPGISIYVQLQWFETIR